ncbi:amidohydrolase family protein [Piscinibacter sp. XHJ-5]|uniref:amidohydrolase family protein n=1 Tax=Piscinibacter sp. XHJ-5 TaxID=3037797 RepID=UPI0024534FE7|nr:amidohydrolase family protein [Piscinibacter sp. XHJ-5]
MTTKPTAPDADDDLEALIGQLRRGVPQPIVETHIHFYQVTRPGGVPWPPAASTTLYRDVLPAEYQQLARLHGIVAAGIVEASPLAEDNAWILDLVRRDAFFRFFVGQLEVGSPGFIAQLDRLAADPRFVGIRSFLWGPAAITLDAAQRRDLAELSRRGMTLDLISRGTTNPKPTVEALCKAFPQLRVIVDHLGGAQGPTPTPEWELSIRRWAELCPQLSVKFSSFYDVYQTGDGNAPWPAPLELAAYRPHFDVLMSAFGSDRLIWGSNWPVSSLGGGFAEQIRLAHDYLAPLGEEVRDKVMFRNALSFYRRVPPRHGAGTRGA